MNCWLNWTTLIANFATIVTAIVAIGIWLRLRSGLKAKTKRLEKYLREKGGQAKAADPSKQGAFNAVIISRDTGLTESEIFQISVNSDRIGRLARMEGDPNRAKEVIFFYKEEPGSHS